MIFLAQHTRRVTRLGGAIAIAALVACLSIAGALAVSDAGSMGYGAVRLGVLVIGLTGASVVIFIARLAGSTR